MSTLSSNHKALLQRLATNEDWQTLLEALESSRQPVPRWKAKGDESEKAAEWIFRSGAEHEGRRVLSILKLEGEHG